MKTLEEIIRDQIGAEGPQLPADEYEQRIDDELENMSAARLLSILSYSIDWSAMGLKPS